jgi:hypothetical protein
MGLDRTDANTTRTGYSPDSAALAAQLSDLARELQQEVDVHAVLSGIVHAALDLIPGTLHASISLTAEQAFLLLTRASSRSNIKLRDIAEHLANSGEIVTRRLPHPSPEIP